MEIAIRATQLPLAEMVDLDSMYRIATIDGMDACVGYASVMFTRLIALPAAENNPDFPDPLTIATLVINGIEYSDVSGAAEVALYHLREQFRPAVFAPGRIPEQLTPPELEDELPQPSLIGELRNTQRTEAVAFFNRADESEPVLGFLYLYRVLEACFDDVLNAELRQWRADLTVTDEQLLRRTRTITQREDVSALRLVLGRILLQADLDPLVSRGILQEATADALSAAIYLRRNSIAHGRRGQHTHVLTPYYIARDAGDNDREWLALMRELAHRALERWVFTA